MLYIFNVIKIYDRRLTSVLLREIKLPRIVVLTGMRQAGKTTLMRQIYDAIDTKHRVFLDLERKKGATPIL